MDEVGATPRQDPRATLVALLGMAAVDLAYLGAELIGAAPLSSALLSGRLLLAAGLLAPGLFLLGGGDLRRLRRAAPAMSVLVAASFVLITWGQRSDLALAYLGFLPAIPLLYALVFPEEPRGALLAGLTLLAASVPLTRPHGFPALMLAELVGTIACTTAVAAYGGFVYRRTRAREAAAIRARSEALAALARSEQSRARAERLAAVGVLADGVAHDVSSPLASLRTNLRFAREELRGGRAADAGEALADADECAGRIHAIVSTLRAVSRSDGSAPAPCDPAEVARAARRLAAPRLPAGVALQLDVPGGLPAVLALRPVLVELLSQMILTAAREVGEGTLRLGASDRPSGAVGLVVRGQAAVAPGRAGPAGDGEPEPGFGPALCDEYAQRIGGRFRRARAGGDVVLELHLPRAGTGPEGAAAPP